MKKTTVRYWLVCLGCIVTSLLCTVQAATATKKLPVLDRIVAVVNHDAITKSELEQQTQLLIMNLRQNGETALPPTAVLKKQLLERMILEKLQLQLAAKTGIEIDDAMLNETLNAMAAQGGLSQQELKQFVEGQGVKFSDFRNNQKNDLIIARLQQQEVGQHITVSQNDITHFLRSPQAQDRSNTDYQLGHILISFPEAPTAEQTRAAEQRAQEIMKQLQAGSDFAQMAIAKSSGQQALSGGDLGWRSMAEIPTLFSRIAPTLAVGQIYGPLRNESGFHIIKLIQKRTTPNPKKAPSPVLTQQKVKEIIYQRKFEERLTTWLKRLKEEAEIQIYLNGA